MNFVGCFACGSKDIEFHESAGHAACVSCGVVQEENAIVSSIEFQEQGDRSHVVGQFISANCTKPFAGTTRGRYGGSRESREATLANAKRVIAQVATSLRLPHYFVDRSFRLYQLALQHNFLFGRRQSHIVATCLYIVCRQEKSPYLLIDFADALQCNVYLLGKNYLQFIRLLGLNLPIIDPALYIHRFAIRLEFNEKMNAVVLTALRMITRFKKDWINIGRRPDGICAAAMLIASRAHGFYKGQQELAKLFRVGSDTIKRRLIDFKSTPAAQLTLDQLRLVGDNYNVENDPPSFAHNQYTENAERVAAGSGQDPGPESFAAVVGDIQVEVPMFTSYSTGRAKSQGTLERDDARATLYQEIHSSLVEAGAANAAAASSSSRSSADNGKGNGSYLVEAYSALQELTADQDAPAELPAHAKATGERRQKFVIAGSSAGTGTGSDVKSEANSAGSSSTAGAGTGDDGIGEDLYLINSDELDAFILTSEEQNKRAIIWERTYRTYLNERERRRKPAEAEVPGMDAGEDESNQRARAASESGTSKTNKRKRVSSSQNVISNSSSYVNNIISNINTASNSGSKKINYNALQSAFEPGAEEDASASAPASSSSASASSAGIDTPSTEKSSSTRAAAASASGSSSAPAMATLNTTRDRTTRTSKFAPTAAPVVTASSSTGGNVRATRAVASKGPAAKGSSVKAAAASETAADGATADETQTPATTTATPVLEVVSAAPKGKAKASKINLPKTGNRGTKGSAATSRLASTIPDPGGEYDFVSEVMGVGRDNDGDD